MIFGGVGGPRLVLSRRTAEEMLRFRQLKHTDPEVGGVLLGRVLRECDDVIVDDVTQPAARDRSSRFNFFRNKTSTQPAVDRAWAASDGTCIYLGEWHTHPEDDPHPSTRDMSNWRTILRTARFEQPWLFFLIVGRQQTKAWIGDRETATISPLTASPVKTP